MLFACQRLARRFVDDSGGPRTSGRVTVETSARHAPSPRAPRTGGPARTAARPSLARTRFAQRGSLGPSVLREPFPIRRPTVRTHIGTWSIGQSRQSSR